MVKSKVAQAVYDGLVEDGQTYIGWNDDRVVDYAGDLVKTKNSHPIIKMRAIFSHLERSPELFEKLYRKSMRSDGREARVRIFKRITDEVRK